MGTAVIFDLDGVLIDSEELQYRAYSTVLARYGVQVTAEEYAIHWIAAGRGPEYAVKTFGLPVTPDELRALRSPVYHAVLREEARLMPGALAALARLEPHFALAIATNSAQEDVTFVVERFGFDAFVKTVITRNDYVGAKPEPDAFLTAAARLGLPPAACLVVEDAHKGVLAAHRAGIPVVAIPNDFTRRNDFSLAAAVLNNLDELTAETVMRLVSGSGTPVRA